jgi:Domain of unknown function (DUF4143)
MDDATQRELLTADPQRLDRAPAPVLIDEWRREPAVWDFVRRSVDRNPAPARFLDAATPGETNKPAKTTTTVYRDVLSQLWLLDPVPGCLPSRSAFSRLGAAPKHHLADPALAARLLGVDVPALLDDSAPATPVRRPGPLLGALFESLVTLSVRVYAQAAEAIGLDGRRKLSVFLMARR